ncbi:MAG: hypothetical protein ACM3SU_10260 [Acidobacteriota bacterium]
MKPIRFALGACWALSIARAASAEPESGPPASPTPAPSSGRPTRSAHDAAVDERGDHVMGFDHEKTRHHFRLTATGGSIEVEASDPTDAESRDAIRMHLSHIAKMLAEKDFEAPMLIHDQVPPGVPAMKRLKAEIRYEFAPSDRGGRVVIVTKNREAVRAIHDFLRFQIREHRAGDPTEIEPASPRRAEVSQGVGVRAGSASGTGAAIWETARHRPSRRA